MNSIKTIIATFALCLGMMTPTAVQATFAESGAAARVARYKDSTIQVSTPDPEGVTAGKWNVSPRLWYSQCDTHAVVKQYQVLIEKVSGKCGTATDWKVNPNVIGDWNPGEKTVNCSNTATVYTLWTSSEVVGKNETQNAKCLGANLQMSLSSALDRDYALPSLCVTFN